MSSKSEHTRIRILDAAWKLLEEGPQSAVRMSDIAKKAKISRQAVYLHFPTRADLLIATTRHLDQVHDVDARLAHSRSVTPGTARLDSFIEAWGNYIPLIWGVAKALLAMKDTDQEADLAWRDRMNAVRHGCAAAVDAVHADGQLTPTLTPVQATDVLWTLLSVRNWEQLTVECSWTQATYVERMQALARRALVV